jgi:hypothetical protein
MKFQPPMLLVVSLSLVACGVFDTREPDPPTQTSSTFTPPTEPAIVFSNMTNAFREMNAVNYVRSFADSATASRNYQFEPTAQARLRYATVFSHWTRQSEQQFFENAKARVTAGSASLEFSSLVAQSIQSDSALYEATYKLTIPHNVSSLPRAASGRALYYLIADQSRSWVIWRWVDIAIAQNDTTWSDLKGAFGQ